MFQHHNSGNNNKARFPHVVSSTQKSKLSLFCFSRVSVCVCVCVCVSHSVMSNSLPPHGLQPAGLLYPWNSPGKNTGEGIHSLLLEIFIYCNSVIKVEWISPPTLINIPFPKLNVKPHVRGKKIPLAFLKNHMCRIVL